MTLHSVEPEPGAIDTIRSHLVHLAARPQFQHRLLAHADPTAVALAAPHGVYTLGLDEIATGASLEAARRVGQRFLVLDGQAAVASAELTAEGNVEANEGPFVAATAAAIEAAEASPQLAETRYEPRLLRIPGIYVVALWLWREGGDDVVIPLDPAPRSLVPGRQYAPAEIMPALAQLARERLAIEDA